MYSQRLVTSKKSFNLYRNEIDGYGRAAVRKVKDY
jgi:hypothetical protein